VLKRSVATLAAGGAGGAPSYQPLSKIVAIVPAVTDGIRQCANAAVATAADARAYVAEYPRSKSDTVNADALTVTSACGDATKVAYTLDGYVNGP